MCEYCDLKIGEQSKRLGDIDSRGSGIYLKRVKDGSYHIFCELIGATDKLHEISYGLDFCPSCGRKLDKKRKNMVDDLLTRFER